MPRKDAASLIAMVQGAEWTGHDVLVVTSPTQPRADAHRARLQKLFSRTPLRLIMVVEQERLGSLGGTVAAWRAVRGQVRPNDRVAIVHDAGHAMRTRPLTKKTAGSRGLLSLGAQVNGQPVDLTGLVAITAAAWAHDASRVDVLWGGQLTLPDELAPPSGLLCKTAQPIDTPATEAQIADLGWFRSSRDGGPLVFAPRGQFTKPEQWSEWAAAGSATFADLGSSSFDRGLLDALDALYAALPARKRDVDPELTHPWLSALAGMRPTDDVAALLRANPDFAAMDSVGLRSFRGTWIRLRHPDEIARALAHDVPCTPALRTLWGLDDDVACVS